MDILAKIQIKAEYIDEFEKGIRALIVPTQAEAGCIRFDFYRQSGSEGVFWIVETWKDQHALNAHYEQPYVKAVMDNYPTWLAVPLEVVHLESFS